ncbi:MAG: hypothetical protein GWN13_04575, partial [Phycisphaerae bacterium]|nr:hypothetical protein [Phycisphaerae bacterium]NIW97516.1 hypothetical protein [Phycisphaerae bacterium]
RGKSDEYIERVAKSFIPDGRELLVQTLTFSVMPVGGHIAGGINSLFGREGSPYGEPLTPEELEKKSTEFINRAEAAGIPRGRQ